MSDDIEQLDEWLNPLIAKLSASQRTVLMRKLARELRTRNRQRMQQQLAPDGTPWEPRKNQPIKTRAQKNTRLRKSRGAIKRKAMFMKLRTSRFLKTTGTPNNATLSLLGRVGRIAAVHHYGLRDKVAHGVMHNYPERPLLGFSEHDINLITDVALNHLGNL